MTAVEGVYFGHSPSSHPHHIATSPGLHIPPSLDPSPYSAGAATAVGYPAYSAGYGYAGGYSAAGATASATDMYGYPQQHYVVQRGGAPPAAFAGAQDYYGGGAGR
eukprot:GHVS01084397.1.p2 GENE.GHVS01084397.1~~GHVS01084397.1.p2  ORF type:complete len:106 (-),score=17.18 GHVS01084397.1:110-427(-)